MHPLFKIVSSNVTIMKDRERKREKEKKSNAIQPSSALNCVRSKDFIQLLTKTENEEHYRRQKINKKQIYSLPNTNECCSTTQFFQFASTHISTAATNTAC